MIAKTMATGQLNANLGDGLMMRVGIPHKGGQLAVHAFNQSYPAMVSANAFWDQKKGKFCFPITTDLSELDFAMDSAGYTAMKSWQRKGTQAGMAGVFPWSCSAYVEFATSCGAAWWSQPDMCCEPEIATNQDEIDYRINATATLLEGTLRQLYAWQNELSKICSATTVANMLPPPVPVLQGWSSQDYLRSLDLLNAVWERWQPWLAPPRLIGIGSVCRRTMGHKTHGLYAILDKIEGSIPNGSKLHLFGVKGACLDDLAKKSWIASADSMAYDFSSRMKALKERRSNTLSRRCEEMTRWMSAAAARIQPMAGLHFG
jgi:hypothetical protein